MKKVMHVFTIVQSASMLEGLLDKLKEKGYECVVVGSGNFEDIGKNINLDETDFCPLDICRDINIAKDTKAVIGLIRLIRKHKPDIIHGHTPKAGLISMIAGLLCGVEKRIFHLHGLRYVTEKGIRRRIICLMEKLTVYCATSVLSVSHSLKDYVIKENICKEDKISVLHNGSIKGVDIKELEDIYRRGKIYYQKKYNIDSNKKIIGFVGRINQDKGVYDLISAIKILEMKRDDFQVVLCGNVEESNKTYLELFDEFVKKHNVRYLGFVTKPLEIMMCFDVLVLPSYREGFGLVNIEANGLGVPVITTDTVGCIDSVAKDFTGIMVQVGNITEIAQALETLLDNACLAKRYGENGRRRVKELYDRNAIWDELIKYYDSLVNTKNPLTKFQGKY